MDFHVGQRVLYEGPYGNKALTTVTKVTPKGGVRINYNPSLLFKRGKASSGPYHFHSIRPATEQDFATIRHLKLAKRLGGIDWKALGHEALLKVAAIVEAEAGKE